MAVLSLEVLTKTDDLHGVYETVPPTGIEPKGPPTLGLWGDGDFQLIDPDGFVQGFEMMRSYINVD